MNKIKEQSTRVYEDHHGWNAETITTANGQTFKITTMKRHSGRIVSDAQPGNASEDDNFRVFTVTDMFQGNIKLISEKGRATENRIREQHNRAVLLFDEKIEAGEIQPEKPERPEIGSILFTDGYGHTKGSEGNNHIVYKIEDCKFYDKEYYTVERDTLKLKRHNGLIKPFSKKFGIGTYFEPGFKFQGSENDLNNLVIEAQQKAEEDRKKEQAAEELAEQIRQAKIEEVRKLVTIPKWAETVIVADLYEDKSDSMTDYFHTSVVNTVYLAWSSKARNDMEELRKAALNFEETKDFPALADENTDREYSKVKENREDHSYLPDYFLGTSQWYGWKVNKRKRFDLSSESNKEALYIAAAEDRYKIPQPDSKDDSKQPSGNVYVEQYSEKAIVVRGDTKPIKEDLKELGGKFNFRLKGGPGWIFPATRTEEIKQALA